jgi:hypothetical protein
MDHDVSLRGRLFVSPKEQRTREQFGQPHRDDYQGREGAA